MSPKKTFRAIAAMDTNRGLGFEGDLPWYLPEDLKYFADVTRTTQSVDKKNTIIMGRVTCESIPDKYWPLPGRRNLVVTRNPSWKKEGAEVHSNLKNAIDAAARNTEDIYVVGGGEIYNLAIQMESCDELLLTQIEKEYKCDAFFPEYKDNYDLAEVITTGSYKQINYRFERWKRKAMKEEHE